MDDDQVTRPGQGEDSGDLDVGQLDTGEPDTGEPDADVAAPSCEDGVQHGNETGEDCGGDCVPCALGVGCEEGADCTSGFCTDNVCVDESCVDVECAQEETCYRSVCYLSCEDADGCDPSSRCFQGACLPLDCSSAECDESETCYRGVCYAACRSDEGCSEEGAECIEGSCVVATCEDGLKNGDETDIDCGGSECEACAPGKMCVDGQDCQEPLATPWVCDFGVNSCAQVGTETRTLTTYTCGDAMTCEVNEEVETRDCTRQTDDQECGETIIGDFGACQGAGEQRVCSTEGRRRRVITSYVCAEGGCEVVEEDDFEDCVLEASERACGTPEFGPWSECGGFENACHQEGTRSRTVTVFECSGSDCNPRFATETETCTRETNGTSCGGSTGAWSDCVFANACTLTNTQSRSVTTGSCSSGGCHTSTTTESQTCTRSPASTNGVTCGTTIESPWGPCLVVAGTCGGDERRSITHRRCSNGSCSDVVTTETRRCEAPAGSGCTCRNRFGSCNASGVCQCELQELCLEGHACFTQSGQSGCCSNGVCRADYACF